MVRRRVVWSSGPRVGSALNDDKTCADDDATGMWLSACGMQLNEDVYLSQHTSQGIDAIISMRADLTPVPDIEPDGLISTASVCMCR